MASILGLNEVCANDKNVKDGNVAAIVNEYEDLFVEGSKYGSKADARRSRYAFIVDTYYNLVTSFYEYGWGTSFHFANRFEGETFEQSIVRHEHYLAGQLNVDHTAHILDMGCGVGGPMRNICRYLKCKVTGITINEYQVKRAREHNKNAHLDDLCSVIQGDFLNLPFENNSFDAVFAVEATVHAPRKEVVYGEAFRVVKPGGMFCMYEWVMTDKWDPKSAEHNEIKRIIEEGDAIPSLDTVETTVSACKKVGFDVLYVEDVALNSQIPWYEPLDGKFTVNGVRRTRFGRALTSTMVRALEFVRIAPAGSLEVSELLNRTADALVESGKLGIFTPMLLVKCRKPATSS